MPNILNLRGLPPDQTLVLANSKRRHRSALENVNVSALSQIPAIAIDRVEVPRDGASAQYGSDAIAGVINGALKEGVSGFTSQARYGQHYEGDGRDNQVAINQSLAFGDDGFGHLSAEYVNRGPIRRGTQRPGALQDHS